MKGLGECQQLKGITHFHFILRIGVEGQRKNMEKNNVSKDRRVYKQKEKEREKLKDKPGIAVTNPFCTPHWRKKPNTYVCPLYY